MWWQRSASSRKPCAVFSAGMGFMHPGSSLRAAKGDAVISWGEKGHSVTLKGVDAASLSATDFLFDL